MILHSDVTDFVEPHVVGKNFGSTKQSSALSRRRWAVSHIPYGAARSFRNVAVHIAVLPFRTSLLVPHATVRVLMYTLPLCRVEYLNLRAAAEEMIHFFSLSLRCHDLKEFIFLLCVQITSYVQM